MRINCIQLSKVYNTACPINVDGIPVKEMNYFRYLETFITRDGSYHTNLRARIQQMKCEFHNLRRTLCCYKMKLNFKIKTTRASHVVDVWTHSFMGPAACFQRRTLRDGIKPLNSDGTETY